MEDFVSVEIAKKLKEKGFREKCLTYYDVEDNVGLLYNTQYTYEVSPCQYTDLLQSHNIGEAKTQPDDSENCVDAPTISQVLKWLREEKNMFVDISMAFNKYYFEIYCTTDYDETYGNQINRKFNEIDYDSYEQAALAGVNYCLENLI